MNIIIFSINLMAGICAFALLIFILYTVYAMLVAAPFLPTHMKNVRKMIELAQAKPGETVMDLGSGDGRIILEAAKTGALCVGIELNPFLYLWSKIRVLFSGYKNIEIHRQDLWATRLYDVEVLMVFFISFRMDKLGKKIKQEMKPGTRVISYGFKFSGWEPTKKIDKVYLYTV